MTTVLQHPRFELHTDSRLVGVGVHDALTAALVTEAGFDVLWVGSFEASACRGLPDANLLTFTEMADVVRAVRSGSPLPVLVDADNGYGSDECAARALDLFADAGVSAMCVEDNAFPKHNSLYSLAERALEEPKVFARRLERLVRRESGVKVVARTEALVAGLGVDEAVRRLRCYADAGVDGLFAQTNAPHADELLPVLERVTGLLPIVLAPTALPHTSADTFHELGVNVVLFANVVCRATIRGLSRMLAELGDTRSLARIADHIADLDDAFRLTGAHAWNPA
jgi:phosphoenolpyruvate phosphomutase